MALTRTVRSGQTRTARSELYQAIITYWRHRNMAMQGRITSAEMVASLDAVFAAADRAGVRKSQVRAMVDSHRPR